MFTKPSQLSRPGFQWRKETSCRKLQVYAALPAPLLEKKKHSGKEIIWTWALGPANECVAWGEGGQKSPALTWTDISKAWFRHPQEGVSVLPNHHFTAKIRGGILKSALQTVKGFANCKVPTNRYVHFFHQKCIFCPFLRHCFRDDNEDGNKTQHTGDRTKTETLCPYQNPRAQIQVPASECASCVTLGKLFSSFVELENFQGPF